MKEWGQWLTHPAYYLSYHSKVKKKKKGEIDMQTVFSEPGMCVESRDGRDKAAALNSLQLWLAARLTAIIVTTKRNC